VADTSVLTFRLEGREYAVPAGDVVEVLRMVAVTPVPEGPPWVCGVLNFRGRVIPVVDARARLGLARRDPDLSTPIVVVEAGERVAGVVVDEALDVLALPGGVEYPDRVSGASPAVCGVAHRGDRLVLVLDSARLCAGSAGLDLAASGWREP
jgi:purine-binding chemotaxis protein CheW